MKRFLLLAVSISLITSSLSFGDRRPHDGHDHHSGHEQFQSNDRIEVTPKCTCSVQAETWAIYITNGPLLEDNYGRGFDDLISCRRAAETIFACGDVHSPHPPVTTPTSPVAAKLYCTGCLDWNGSGSSYLFNTVPDFHLLGSENASPMYKNVENCNRIRAADTRCHPEILWP
jgi:hypothetical protein